MSENSPSDKTGKSQTTVPVTKNTKNPPLRNPDESESDISNQRSINAEESGFDADGEMSDITVRVRKKRERKSVRASPTKKKRSPSAKNIETPKSDDTDPENNPN